MLENLLIGQISGIIKKQYDKFKPKLIELKKSVELHENEAQVAGLLTERDGTLFFQVVTLDHENTVSRLITLINLDEAIENFDMSKINLDNINLIEK